MVKMQHVGLGVERMQPHPICDQDIHYAQRIVHVFVPETRG
jgi:hypothetical protein